MVSTWTERAAAQHGAISRAQLRDDGVTSSAIDRLLSSGRLEIARPGVYVVPGSADTVHRRRWVALLAIGDAAVLSFETAARIHDLHTVAASGPTVLTVPHSGWQRHPGIVVHQISDLSPDDVLCIDGMPVTGVERTIVDLAAIWRRGRVRLVVENSVDRKLTTDVAIGTCLRSVARRGKPGVRVLTSVLDDRGPGKAPPLSELERAFAAMVVPSPLPEPIRQYPLPRNDGVRNLVDAAWPDVQLIVEVDGRRWHQRLADMKRDRDRDLKAAAAGWQVIRLLYEHIVGAPDLTIADLVAVHEARARQLHGAA